MDDFSDLVWLPKPGKKESITSSTNSTLLPFNSVMASTTTANPAAVSGSGNSNSINQGSLRQKKPSSSSTTNAQGARSTTQPKTEDSAFASLVNWDNLKKGETQQPLTGAQFMAMHQQSSSGNPRPTTSSPMPSSTSSVSTNPYTSKPNYSAAYIPSASSTMSASSTTTPVTSTPTPTTPFSSNTQTKSPAMAQKVLPTSKPGQKKMEADSMFGSLLPETMFRSNTPDSKKTLQELQGSRPGSASGISPTSTQQGVQKHSSPLNQQQEAWNFDLLEKRSTSPPLQQPTPQKPVQSTAAEMDFFGISGSTPTNETKKVIAQSAEQSVKVDNKIPELPSKNVPSEDDDPFGIFQGSSKPKDSKENIKVIQSNVKEVPKEPLEKPPAESRKAENNEETKQAPSQEFDMDAALAQMVNLGFDVEASHAALTCTHSVQEAIDLIVSNNHVQLKGPSKAPITKATSKPQRDKWDDDYDGDEDEAEWERRRQEPSSTQSRGQKMFSVASGITSSVFSKATTLFDASKKKLAPAIQDIKARIHEARAGPISPSQPHPDFEPIEGGFTDEPSNIGMKQQSEEVKPKETTPVTSNTSLPKQERSKENAKKSSRESAKGTSLLDSFEDNTEAQRQVHPNVETQQNGFQPFSDLHDLPAKNEYHQNSKQSQNTPNIMPSKTNKTNSSVPVKPMIHRLQRPVVEATAEQIAFSAEEKEKGNKNFKLGQFGNAIDHYTSSINYLPTKHQSLIPLYNNRAMAHLKNDAPKMCISDCNEVLAIFGIPEKPSESTIQKDSSVPCSDVLVDFSEFPDPEDRSQLIKVYTRRAAAYEATEKYIDAVRDYKLVLILDPSATVASVGMQRCGKLHRMEGQAVSMEENKKPPTEDLHDLFNPLSSVNGSTSIAAAKAAPVLEMTREETEKLVENSQRVEEMRQQAALKDAEDDEKLRLKDDIDAKINEWRQGKEQNLRALLSSLDTILWPELQWTSFSLADLVTPNKVKIKYMKAIAKVHPDKLSPNESVEHRIIANGVFSTLNESWDIFKAQNNLS